MGHDPGIPIGIGMGAIVVHGAAPTDHNIPAHCPPAHDEDSGALAGAALGGPSVMSKSAIRSGRSGGCGCMQLGNVVLNWGTTVADTTGVTVSFAQPYADNVPSVVSVSQYGEQVGITITKTDVTIRSQSGASTVCWQAIGS